jgi:hypothetical protein
MTMGDRIKPNAKHTAGDKLVTADPLADSTDAPAGVGLEPATSVEAASEQVTTSSS